MNVWYDKLKAEQDEEERFKRYREWLNEIHHHYNWHCSWSEYNKNGKELSFGDYVNIYFKWKEDNE